MFPLSTIGVICGKGRLGEDIESRKKAQCLVEIEVANMAAAFLVQQLQGEQTQQGAGGGDHLRAGITSLRNESLELELGQQWEKEENARDAGA
jgi:hypothetical protein